MTRWRFGSASLEVFSKVVTPSRFVSDEAIRALQLDQLEAAEGWIAFLGTVAAFSPSCRGGPLFGGVQVRPAIIGAQHIVVPCPTGGIVSNRAVPVRAGQEALADLPDILEE